jgi:hypothetical protein
MIKARCFLMPVEERAVYPLFAGTGALASHPIREGKATFYAKLAIDRDKAQG